MGVRLRIYTTSDILKFSQNCTSLLFKYHEYCKSSSFRTITHLFAFVADITRALIILLYYTDTSVLLENTPLEKFIGDQCSCDLRKSYRESSGIFGKWSEIFGKSSNLKRTLYVASKIAGFQCHAIQNR